MALHEMNFEFKPTGKNYKKLEKDFVHSGVVGSGDLEILVQSRDFGGVIKAKVTTPVRGYDEIWELVLERFVEESNVGDVEITINDNNATPFVVSMRLKQAWKESLEEGV